MKRIILSILLFASVISLSAQNNAPTSFSWQGVFREGDMVMKNEPIDKIIFIIIEDLANCDGNGNTVYQEEHPNLTTNDYGLLNLLIGEGTTTSPGDWGNLRWGVNCYFLKTEAIIDGNLIDLGLSKVTGVHNHWVKNENNKSISYSGDHIKLEGIDDADLNLNISSAATSNPEIRFLIDGEQKAFLRLQHTSSNLRLYENLSGNPTELYLTNGKVGIGNSNPSHKLTVHGSTSVGNAGDGNILLNLNSERNWQFRQVGIGAGTKLELKSIGGGGNKHFIINTTGRVGIGTDNPESTLHVNGTTSSSIIKVLGSDIIERVHASESIQPGEVIIIDSSKPNHALKSKKAYDSKVLGVVSGAGPVTHGMELSQKGVLDGNIKFAIAGRVYVKVVGKVKPGDLLTTSNVSGRAMKVKKFRKAKGAIIGKALTVPNKDNLVLMLVNQQ